MWLARRSRSAALAERPPLVARARGVAEAGASKIAERLRRPIDALQGELRRGGRFFDGDVLIVEVDAVQARLLGLGLSRSGWRVHIARTAAEAERILERGPVTMVILDLVLPDRDGRNLLLQLREDPDIRGTRSSSHRRSPTPMYGQSASRSAPTAFSTCPSTWRNRSRWYPLSP